MSRSSTTRLGPWLGLMIAYALLVSLVLLLGITWVLWLAAHTNGFPQGVLALTLGTGFVCLANIAGGLLLLIHRHSRSVTVMIVAFLLACVISGISTFANIGFAPDGLWQGKAAMHWTLLLRGSAQALQTIVAYAGWIAYLLTAPRVTQLYAGRPLSIEADESKAMLPLRPLLFGLSLWGLMELVALLLAGRVSPVDTLAPGLQMFPIEAPGYQLGIALLLLLPQIGVGALLGFGQRWWSLRLALVALWLLPLLAGLHWLGARGSGVALSLFIDPFPAPLPAAFGALGWTAYLLESPYIRNRFAGPPLKERLTNVDVF